MGTVREGTMVATASGGPPTQGIDPARAMQLLNQRTGGDSAGLVGPSCPCHTGGKGEYCLPVAGDGSAAAATPSVTTHDMSGMDVPELARLLRAMQTERVESYAMFEDGFNTFLDQLSAPRYEQLCAQVTAEFAHISGAINAIADAMDEQGSAPLARMVRGLQGLEKRKLSVTVELQLVRRELRVLELRAAVDEAAAELAPEKHAQSATLRSGLAELVGEINEVMDEIQCEVTELLEANGD
jgi:hypothetical protein